MRELVITEARRKSMRSIYEIVDIHAGERIISLCERVGHDCG
jgi:hypothetical protein